MNSSILRKAKIIFNRSTKSIRRTILEVRSEFSLIVKNNRYSKNFPEIFAIFSIIEQEQNTKIFQNQAKNFDLVSRNVLKSNDSPSDVLNALRGVFHNRNIPEDLSDVKKKMVIFLYKETKKIINLRSDYNNCLVKVLLFEFPFLVSYSDHSIFSAMIRVNNRGINRIIRDLFINYENLDFFKKEEDVLNVLNMCLSYNNKSVYMLLLRFIRQSNMSSILFLDLSSSFRKKVLSSKVITEKGTDYGSMFLTFYGNSEINDKSKQEIEGYLKYIAKMKISEGRKLTKYQNIIKYLGLSSKMGMKNDAVAAITNKFIIKNNFIKSVKKKKRKTGSSFDQESELTPGTHVKSGTILNISKLDPEDYWIMNHAGYLI